MDSQDPYAELALVYDDWQYLYPQPFCLSLRPRLIQVLEEFSVPGETYADLGCGTGIFAAWWKQRFPNWRVFGLDQSPAMIEQARKTATRGAQKQALMHWGLSTRSIRAASFDEMMAAAEEMQARVATEPTPTRAEAMAPVLGGAGAPAVPQSAEGDEAQSKSGVDFRVQSMQRIDLPEPLGIATCLFDGVNHLLRTTELEIAFQSVASSLAPGGLFVFDLVHEDIFSEAFDGSVIRKGPGLVVTAESIQFTRSDVLFGKSTFAIFREEGSGWRRYDAEISERCWTRREIRAALHNAGLALLRQDDIDPAIETEFQLPRTFWICRRPMEGRTS